MERTRVVSEFGSESLRIGMRRDWFAVVYFVMAAAKPKQMTGILGPWLGRLSSMPRSMHELCGSVYAMGGGPSLWLQAGCQAKRSCMACMACMGEFSAMLNFPINTASYSSRSAPFGTMTVPHCPSLTSPSSSYPSHTSHIPTSFGLSQASRLSMFGSGQWTATPRSGTLHSDLR